MLRVESIHSLADLRQSHGLRDLVLETPRALMEINSGNPPRVRISGWVLAENARSDIGVVVKGREVEQKIPLNRNRPDVINAHGAAPELSVCGFDAELTLAPSSEQHLEISIEIGAELYRWCWISVGVIAKYKAPAKVWNALASGDWRSIDSQFMKSIDGQQVDDFCGIQMDRHVCLLAINDLSRMSWLPKECRATVTAICEHYSRPHVVEEIVEQALSLNRIECSVPGVSVLLRCDANVAFGDLNFLIFFSATETFILIQYCYSAVGVFYPRWNLSISWTHWGAEFKTWMNMLLRHVFRNLAETVAYLSQGTPRSFAHFILANERPYHFFYDHVSVLFFLSSKQRGASQPFPVASLSSSAYISMSDVLGKQVAETSFQSAEEINRSNWAKRSFSILLGGPNKLLVGRTITLNYFDLIAAAARRVALLNKDLTSRLENLRSCAMVLWVGVTSQKRMWTEQEDGLVQIITLLYERNPSLAVVFDGWTAPLSPKESDLREAEKDREVMNRIIARLPAGIVIDSLIGATSAEKIAVGVEVDYYITNWLQGSLHVDNICKKPGVGHFNTHWRSYDTMYYHHRCVRIADDLITNVGEGRADMLSYSISWREIYRALLDLMPPVAATATSS